MDYDAAKLFLKSIDTDMIFFNGTAIAQALDTSISSLSKDDKQEKMIFLFSDGEDHSKDSIEAIKSKLTMMYNSRYWRWKHRRFFNSC
ncbi:MAG: hypothetical protein Ct9H90mP15_06550 [Candidatus Neomarinimicrobiota bacterium]|nr:MAG: hypothetical protein Ct9H90mP15_06550 [Candidatus Neomarinimicrobiota bacterium]